MHRTTREGIMSVRGLLVIIFMLNTTTAAWGEGVARVLDGIQERVKLARLSTQKRPDSCVKAYQRLFSAEELKVYFIFGVLANKKL